MAVTYKGRTVFTEPGEMFDPKHTAVLVIDVQNEFLSPGGVFAQRTSEYSQALRACLPGLQALVPAAQQAGARVVYSGASHPRHHGAESDANMSRLLAQWKDPPEWALKGSWGADWVPELPKLTDRDFEVPKHRASAFEGTDLDMLLRANRIESVLIAGQSASGCVFYSAHDAMMAGYYVGVATDCISDREQRWHDAALVMMPRLFNYVGPSTPITATW